MSNAFVQAVQPSPVMYDVYADAEAYILFALAAGENVLYDVLNPSAEEEAAAVLGVREFYIGEFDEDGRAESEEFIFLAKLRQGDTGPTPEAVTEDTTYDNGVVVSNQTGVNNGSKTWEIEGSADSPAISMLIDHCRIPGFGTPEKRGKAFAYIAYNEDRSSIYGVARVNTASPPRDGTHRWVFTIAFETVNLRRPSENPVSGVTPPTITSLAPTTGAVGTSVTLTGTNLGNAESLDFGSAVIQDEDFTSRSATTIVFAVPTGQTAGAKQVKVNYQGGETAGSTFTVS